MATDTGSNVQRLEFELRRRSSRTTRANGRIMRVPSSIADHWSL